MYFTYDEHVDYSHKVGSVSLTANDSGADDEGVSYHVKEKVDGEIIENTYALTDETYDLEIRNAESGNQRIERLTVTSKNALGKVTTQTKYRLYLKD